MTSMRAIVSGQLSTALRATVLIAGLIVAPVVSNAQTSRPCLAPDSTSAAVARLAVTLVTDTSAAAMSFRSRFSLPAATAADVTVVQDNATCEAATAAMDSVATHAQSAYHVIRIGSVIPFYLLAQGQTLGIADVYLLNAQLKLLTVFR
jgi:hypothetical protein